MASDPQPGDPPLLLEVISGNAAGASIHVDDELVLGRLAPDDGRLGDDPELSRHHARISRERDGRYAIEDLGSSNGTFVNGLRITSPGLLSVGDSIELGATALVVRAIATATAEPEPAGSDDPFSGATVFARAPSAEPEAPAETEAPPSPPAEPPDPFRSETVFAPVPAAEPPSGPPPGAADQPTSAPGVVPSAPTEVPVAEPVPPLDLRLRVDFEAREAEVALGDGGEPVRFVLDSGRWTVAPRPPA